MPPEKMTLDEAIEHARWGAGEAWNCAEDQQQLARWLEGLRHTRRTIAEIDDSLRNGSDEDLWPVGFTRGEAVARLVAAVLGQDGDPFKPCDGEDVWLCQVCSTVTRDLVMPRDQEKNPYCPHCRAKQSGEPYPHARDRRHPCDDFKPGNSPSQEDCWGDDHHLCKECIYFDGKRTSYGYPLY